MCESSLSVLLDLYLEVGLLDSMVILFVIFGGTVELFPTVAIPYSSNDMIV